MTIVFAYHTRYEAKVFAKQFAAFLQPLFSSFYMALYIYIRLTWTFAF